jgi:hypothetical protein
MWLGSRGWCCDGLRGHFERRHERGLFVFAEPPVTDGQRPASFWLAMRSVQEKDLERVRELNAPDIPMTLQTWYPIHYCPWCGVELSRQYIKQWDLLVDPVLSQEHGWQG